MEILVDAVAARLEATIVIDCLHLYSTVNCLMIALMLCQIVDFHALLMIVAYRSRRLYCFGALCHVHVHVGLLDRRGFSLYAVSSYNDYRLKKTNHH